MSLPSALDVGRQAGQPDAAWCWSDRCYKAANPGRGEPPLGLCWQCSGEIVPTVIPRNA